MGADSWDVSAAVGPGILVSIKHIKEKFLQSPDSKGVKVGITEVGVLDEQTTAWLVQQSKGYYLYNVLRCFILVAPQPLLYLPGLDLCGPYEISAEDETCEIKVEPSLGDDMDSKLLEIAQKLRPEGSKLSFRPGTCLFHYTSGDINLFHSAEEKKETIQNIQMKPADFVGVLDQEGLPKDISIVVGKGDAQKTICSTRAVLSYFVKGFSALLGEKEQLELPDLDPKAVIAVINYHTTREKTKDRFPPRWGMPDKDREAIEEVYKVLKGNEGKPPPSKKSCTSPAGHPTLAETQWRDATFLVGKDKTEIKANRACLAAMNPALKLILYGSGQLAVDPDKPIEWDSFQAEAVDLIFQAILARGKTEVVVPLEFAESAKQFLDFICESEASVKIYFETKYERKYDAANYGSGKEFGYFYDSEGYILDDA